MPNGSNIDPESHQTGVHLSGARHQLYIELSKLEAPKRLHEMYSGGVRTLSDRLNTDRHAQSALSMRELMMALPDAFDVPIVQDRLMLKQRFQDLNSRFERLKTNTGSYQKQRWIGNVIDSHLEGFLTWLHRSLEKVKVGLPKQSDRFGEWIGERLERRLSRQPEVSQDRGRRWVKLFVQFNRILHHTLEISEKEMEDLIDELTYLLLDLITPRVTDDIKEIQALISTETSHD